MFCSMERHQLKMTLRLFKPLLAQMTKVNVLMEKLAASFSMEAMVVFLFLKVFVVKTGFTVAPMQQHAVKLVVVLFLTLFVVGSTTVAPIIPNVKDNMGAVSGHILCLC